MRSFFVASRLFTLSSLLLAALSLSVASPDTHAAERPLKPGLVGAYYHNPPLKNDLPIPEFKPFFVRVDKRIDFPEVPGEFYGSKLSDNFFIRWRGVLRIEKPGRYSFFTHSDDGSRLFIDGKKVVENWGPHSMTEKSGAIELAAGDHAFEVHYTEGGGGAGCIVRWTPPGENGQPGGAKQVIPDKALFHRAEHAAIAWNKQTWANAKKPASRKPSGGKGTPYDAKKHGPWIGTAVHLGEDNKGANIAFRGMVIPLDKEAKSGVVFCADTMRMAAGWIDGQGELVLQGLPFTGGHGAFPRLDGDKLFVNRAGPGWADAKGKLDDPREAEQTGVWDIHPPLGPLPRAHSKFLGHYLNGDRVVLKYRIGGATVLETVDLMRAPGVAGITRQLQVSRIGKPMTLVISDLPGKPVSVESDLVHVADVEGESRFIGVRSKTPAQWRVVSDNGKDHRLLLHLPASDAVAVLAITYASAATTKKAEVKTLASNAVWPNHDAMTKPGPARWGEPIATKGELANVSDKRIAEQPYVLDRITVPYSNPFGSPLRIGGMDFFSDGKRAAVSTWDGEVWIVSGIDDKLENVKWQRFATGLHEALGLKIVNDVIYTVDDAQITRFHDTNGDGEADFYECFNNDWDLTSGFHAFCFDLHTMPNGDFVFAFGSPVRGGGRSFERMGRHHGSILRVSKDGSRMTRYASGLRAPNGIGVSPTGQITTGDNEGTFVPRCPINWVEPGEFLGVVDSYADRDKLKTTPTVRQLNTSGKTVLDPSEMPKPLCWMPKPVDNSGGGQVWVTSDKWGPLNGELLHMSYGRSSLYLVLKEDKGGVMQGGVVKFPLKFTSSCMRARFNPRDGQLYVAGLKGWQTNAGKNGGFDRVRFTGKPVAMPNKLEIKKDGFVVGFTCKLDEELANDPGSFSVIAQDIRWTHGYGSGEYKLGGRENNKYENGNTPLKVTAAKLLPDGKSVYVKVAEMQPAHLMRIRVDVESVDGDEIVTDIYNTVHAVE